MFFQRKINPQDKASALELLLLWDKHIDTVDNATDAMRQVAAEDGIQSERFEEKRLAAAEVVIRLHEETKDSGRWPKLEDGKGSNFMLMLRSKLNEVHAQQLDSLRLQREYVEALKGDRLVGGEGESLASFHQRMEKDIIEMGKAAAGLAKHYKLRPQEYMMRS